VAEAKAVEAKGLAEATAVEAVGLANAKAIEAKGLADGKAVEAIGLARAEATEAVGIAAAKGYEPQVAALGAPATALVAISQAIAEGHVTVVPEVLVTGGGGGSLDGLAASLIRYLGAGNGSSGRGDAAPTPSTAAVTAAIETIAAEPTSMGGAGAGEDGAEQSPAG
jgi:uncharacterized membrane protein YqiK